MEQAARGKLMIIGGGEDKKDECEILKEVVEISGGENSKIIIITTATEKPEEVGQTYSDIFKKIGAKEVDILDISKREDANTKATNDKLKNATCVFFTGGDQLRITSILGGSGIDDMLKRLNREGLVIAGTSAGASVMSKTMIIEGESEDAPRKCTINMAPGLGLLKDVIIDQHFAQRGRIGRLLAAVAENPNNLGVGIDEDTAIIVEGKYFKVIGSNAVTVVDGHNLTHTNVSELSPNEILALTNIIVHILPSGYGFNIETRKPLLKVKEDK